MLLCLVRIRHPCISTFTGHSLTLTVGSAEVRHKHDSNPIELMVDNEDLEESGGGRGGGREGQFVRIREVWRGKEANEARNVL